jgi:hypothetical protein
VMRKLSSARSLRQQILSVTTPHHDVESSARNGGINFNKLEVISFVMIHNSKIPL